MTTPSNMQEPHNAFEQTVRKAVKNTCSAYFHAGNRAPYETQDNAVETILAAHRADVREVLERIKTVAQSEHDEGNLHRFTTLEAIDAELAQLNAEGEKHE